jgi:hypothetical protein
MEAMSLTKPISLSLSLPFLIPTHLNPYLSFEEVEQGRKPRE